MSPLPSLNEEETEEAVRLHRGGLSYKSVAARMGKGYKSVERAIHAYEAGIPRGGGSKPRPFIGDIDADGDSGVSGALGVRLDAEEDAEGEGAEEDAEGTEKQAARHATVTTRPGAILAPGQPRAPLKVIDVSGQYLVEVVLRIRPEALQWLQWWHSQWPQDYGTGTLATDLGLFLSDLARVGIRSYGVDLGMVSLALLAAIADGADGGEQEDGKSDAGYDQAGADARGDPAPAATPA